MVQPNLKDTALHDVPSPLSQKHSSLPLGRKKQPYPTSAMLPQIPADGASEGWTQGDALVLYI